MCYPFNIPIQFLNLISRLDQQNKVQINFGSDSIQCNTAVKVIHIRNDITEIIFCFREKHRR